MYFLSLILKTVIMSLNINEMVFFFCVWRESVIIQVGAKF
jgi:hypothetical protein